MDYPFLVFVAILIIIAFSISYFKKEKLDADFDNAFVSEKDNVILEIRGAKGKQNRVRPLGGCKIDLFLTDKRLYITTLMDTINQLYPPHPLILTREELNGYKKCKLVRINLNSYSDSMFFRFNVTDEIRIFNLTTEQKELIDTVLKSKENIDNLYIYYLEKMPE